MLKSFRFWATFCPGGRLLAWKLNCSMALAPSTGNKRQVWLHIWDCSMSTVANSEWPPGQKDYGMKWTVFPSCDWIQTNTKIYAWIQIGDLIYIVLIDFHRESFWRGVALNSTACLPKEGLVFQAFLPKFRLSHLLIVAYRTLVT